MAGTSLIEVVIALAIFSCSILGGTFLSLQGLKLTRQSMQETQNVFYSLPEMYFSAAPGDGWRETKYFLEGYM